MTRGKKRITLKHVDDDSNSVTIYPDGEIVLNKRKFKIKKSAVEGGYHITPKK